MSKNGCGEILNQNRVRVLNFDGSFYWFGGFVW